MFCPFCNSQDTNVVDSRFHEETNQVKRRRRCKQCNKRFTTYETVELSMPRVIKQDGNRQYFDENKLRDGVLRALEKRPVSVDLIDQMMSRVKEQILFASDREISSRDIGEKVMSQLRQLDHVAYVRFASVYRDFKDIDDFQEELNVLAKQNPTNK